MLAGWRVVRRGILPLIILAIALGVLAAGEAPPYHGNNVSFIFHGPQCRYYQCKNCVIKFNSRQDALKAGYRPCKICNP